MTSSSASGSISHRSDRSPAAAADERSESFELSPSGVLHYRGGRRDLRAAFAEGEATGLMALGGRPAEEGADASLRYWKGFADTYVRELCQVPDGVEELPEISPPDAATLAGWVLDAPPMRGAEYLSPDKLRGLRDRLECWTRERLASSPSLASFLDEHAPAWSRVGRVTLHLAEHREDPEFPFAFLATYASSLTGSGRLRQSPLGKALQQYGGAKNKPMLLRLLTPIHAAAGACPLMTLMTTAARSRRVSGGGRGAIISRRWETTRTGSRAGAPTCATGRCCTCRWRRGGSNHSCREATSMSRRSGSIRCPRRGGNGYEVAAAGGSVRSSSCSRGASPTRS